MRVSHRLWILGGETPRTSGADAVRSAAGADSGAAARRANYGVYGVRKMWWLLNREGHQVGRDRVALLMRAAGLRGVVRGRKVFTTTADDRDHRLNELVQRRFTAAAPNRLWVADLTY